MRRLSRRALAPALAGVVAIVLGGCAGGGERPPAEREAPRPAQAAAGPPHLVMVVFDEFPLFSLLDAQGRIDATRYPNFARIAGDGTWYRNATTVHDSTSKAVPAILTGRLPRDGTRPSLADHPRNLFTLLGGRMRANVWEEATAMCPARVCRSAPRARCPRGKRPPCHSVVGRLRSGRIRRFDAFVRRIEPGAKPGLEFAHVLMPHAPWEYLPSGRSYRPRRVTGELLPGAPPSASKRDAWLVTQAQQRHLLQLGYVDRMIGRLIARLEATGLYDRSAIVLAADHGLSFGRAYDRRAATPGNLGQVVSVPMIVKAPGQREARVSDAYVQTVDLLPTIAELLGVRVPWPTDGRPADGAAVGGRRSVTLLLRRSMKPGTVGRRLRLSGAAIARQRDAALRRKIALFGAGSDSLFRAGPHADLIGRPLAELRPGGGRTRAALDGVSRAGALAVGRGPLPAHLTGRLLGRPSRRTRALLVAVDGRVVAVTRTALAPDGREHLSAILPEDILAPGRRRVELIAVGGAGDARRYARIVLTR